MTTTEAAAILADLRALGVSPPLDSVDVCGYSMDMKCSETNCSRTAGTYRVILSDGTIGRLCSRHAAIRKHDEAERIKRENGR